MLSDNFTESPFVNVIHIGQQLKAPSIICLHITQDFNYLTAICKEGKIIYIYFIKYNCIHWKEVAIAALTSAMATTALPPAVYSMKAVQPQQS